MPVTVRAGPFEESSGVSSGHVFTVMVTEFALLQPVAVIFSVRVYLVVAVGFAFGFETVPEESPVVGDHEYVCPLIVAVPSESDLPLQMVALEPVVASGNGFTVTCTELEFVQPVAVIFSVRVYKVVSVGLAVGLEMVEEESPELGDQENV